MLVHFKPCDYLEVNPHADEVEVNKIRKLESKNILAAGPRISVEKASEGIWIYRATTKAVAEWSCKTAAAMVAMFADNVPQGAWGSSVKMFATGFGYEY